MQSKDYTAKTDIKAGPELLGIAMEMELVMSMEMESKGPQSGCKMGSL